MPVPGILVGLPVGNGGVILDVVRVVEILDVVTVVVTVKVTLSVTVTVTGGGHAVVVGDGGGGRLPVPVPVGPVGVVLLEIG